MIILRYITRCDNCTGEEEREIIFDNEIVLLENKNVAKLYSPALPDGWLIQRTTQAGKPDKHFCCPQCKAEHNKARNKTNTEAYTIL